MKPWIPTICLGFAAFIFVTSEFMPVGLLPVIAAHFGQTEAETGLMMTIYAWIVAAFSLPLTAYAARFDRRTLHLALVLAFFLAQIFSACAGSFRILVVSRMFVAAAHAVFWAVAPPFAARLAPQGKREHGITVVAAGANLGGVLGIPLVTYVGQAFGWRFAFAAVGAAAAVVGAALYRYLPSRATPVGEKPVSVAELFRRPALVLVYLITVISMTGHYATFTFITPYLERVGALRSALVPSVLLVYGAAGLLASFAAPPLLRARRLKPATMLSMGVIALCLLALRPAVSTTGGAMALLAVWAAVFLYLNLVLQKLVLDLAPDAEDVATAGYSGIYNIGIGAGALIGSGAAASGRLPMLGFGSAGFVLLGGCLFVILFQKMRATPLESKGVSQP